MVRAFINNRECDIFIYIFIRRVYIKYRECTRVPQQQQQQQSHRLYIEIYTEERERKIDKEKRWI